MSKDTKIEWADHTFNPWVGCTKVSTACDHCYAEVWAKRSGMVQWGPQDERRRTSFANWKQPLKWNAEAKRLGIRYRVFCASLADVFDNSVPNEWRADLFGLILQTPDLDWLLLTKRIGNARSMLVEAGDAALMATFGSAISTSFAFSFPNVWLGATICNQEEADRDILKLLDTPAVKRFLSIEPLLGPVNLTQVQCGARVLDVLQGGGFHETHFESLPQDHHPCVDWVIVGGESGHGARPMHPKWVRSLRDQCLATGTAFTFKQWGEWAPTRPGIEIFSSSSDYKFDDGTWVEFLGKKKAGRMLDGREFNEVPV